MTQHDHAADDLVTLVPLEGDDWRFRLPDFVFGLGIGGGLLLVVALVAVRFLH